MDPLLREILGSGPNNDIKTTEDNSGYTWISNPINDYSPDSSSSEEEFIISETSLRKAREFLLGTEYESSIADPEDSSSEYEFSSSDTLDNLPQLPDPPILDESSDEVEYTLLQKNLNECNTYLTDYQVERDVIDSEITSLLKMKETIQKQMDELECKKYKEHESEMIKIISQQLDEFTMAVSFLMDLGEFEDVRDLIIFFINNHPSSTADEIKKIIIADAREEYFNELLTSEGLTRDEVTIKKSDEPAPKFYDQSISDSFIIKLKN